MHTLINGDCLQVLKDLDPVDCIMSDCPDNIGLKYGVYSDNKPVREYANDLYQWLLACVFKAPVVWWSFNARWTIEMGVIAKRLQGELSWLDVKPCVQYFTFFQQNQYDLGNAHRPTWRFMRKDTPLYPDSIRIPSWRLLNGDPRANPEGCVPGDVFDIPRVTGNSQQRRAWHPTQLNEDLVTRCIKLVTQEGATVLDPFAGTGTTMRVCKGIKRNSVSIELDRNYCDEIVKEHGMQPTSENSWHLPEAVAWWESNNAVASGA